MIRARVSSPRAGWLRILYMRFDKEDQRALAIWATGCAERVPPLFETAYPKDDRPRRVIEACRAWIRTGLFTMADTRKASLGAHAGAAGLSTSLQREKDSLFKRQGRQDACTAGFQSVNGR